MLCIKVFMTVFAIATGYSDIEDNYHTALLGNHETLKKFYMCLVDKSPCDSFGKEVKGHLVEALKDNCRECDPTQKHYAHIVMTLLKSDYPDMYEVFEAKYDPKRNLFPIFTTKTKDF